MTPPSLGSFVPLTTSSSHRPICAQGVNRGGSPREGSRNSSSPQPPGVTRSLTSQLKSGWLGRWYHDVLIGTNTLVDQVQAATKGHEPTGPGCLDGICPDAGGLVGLDGDGHALELGLRVVVPAPIAVGGRVRPGCVSDPLVAGRGCDQFLRARRRCGTGGPATWVPGAQFRDPQSRSVSRLLEAGGVVLRGGTGVVVGGAAVGAVDAGLVERCAG